MNLRGITAFSLRILLPLLALFAWAQPALANVTVSFHSFNGSMFFGRYPHTFVVFDGVLDGGQKVHENFGFTAKSVTPAILSGPVEGEIWIEQEKWIARTNTHFAVTVDDATYDRLVRNVYKVLLTRGLVGTLLYSVDAETQEMLRAVVNPR